MNTFLSLCVSLRSASHARGVRTSEQSYGHEHGPTHLLQPSSDAFSPVAAQTRTTTSPCVPYRSSPRSPHHADARRTLVAPRNDHVCTETPFALTHWPQYWRIWPGHLRLIVKGRKQQLRQETLPKISKKGEKKKKAAHYKSYFETIFKNKSEPFWPEFDTKEAEFQTSCDSFLKNIVNFVTFIQKNKKIKMEDQADKNTL